MKGTPMATPIRRTRHAGLAVLTAILLAACGGGTPAEGDAGDGGGAGASARPPQEQILVTSADAATPFQLQAGRYKFGWDAATCTAIGFTMSGQAKGFVYEKTTRQKKFSAIVSDVPDDVYTLAQNEAECTEWTVQIDRIGS
jgi:hypothetical protein